MRYYICTITVVVALGFCSAAAIADCAVGGIDTRPGLEGSITREHPFLNQCLAASGTDVTITVEAMADLGCNAWDGTHDPPTGEECPESCTPTCCDTAPQDKYVTVTANSHALNPSVSGSSNMPTNGRFFAEWLNDCDGDGSEECLQAGRSPCFAQTPQPKAHTHTRVFFKAVMGNLPGRMCHHPRL